MATAHAKNRPPSAAKRWLPCPFSATVAPLYPNAETEASTKGDLWHSMMEDLLQFGTLSLEADPDAAEALQDLYDYVVKRFKELGPNTTMGVEEQLDVTETGEFGTADIRLLSPDWLEIVDEKSGYIVVDVIGNEQMLTYLCAAIDKYGERPKYRIGVHQPNYDHIDGPLRFWEPTHADVEAHRARLRWSMENPDHCEAGHHCKASYCNHRGACEAFRVYVENDLSLGWFPSELKSMSDADLSKALDASDEAAGWRTELRAEAMRRIINMDRQVVGYKVVKGRRNREVRQPQALIFRVVEVIGSEWAFRMFPDMQWAQLDLLPMIAQNAILDEHLLKYLGTPKHIEDVLKQYARVHNLPRGGWKLLYQNVVGEYITETAAGLTLERAIDGRPAHKRGSEFGALLSPATSPNLNNVL